MDIGKPKRVHEPKHIEIPDSPADLPAPAPAPPVTTPAPSEPVPA